MVERPTTLEQLAAGHPAAERQLRALRAVHQYMVYMICGEDHNWCTGGRRLLAELDAADAAAKEREHG